MAKLAPNLVFRWFDANGNPLASGKVFTYIAGTSTPLATYTDATEATPNTNPVILDSNGEADIWLKDAFYKFVIKDANDVVLDTVDGIATVEDVLAGAVTAKEQAEAAAAEAATAATTAAGTVVSTHNEDTTDVHGISDTSTLLTTTNTKTVTNKDIDGGTASNSSRITLPKNTKSNLDSLARKEGSVTYCTDLKRLYFDSGTELRPVGSGSGTGVNYIDGGNAESGLIGSLYADGSAIPVDGSGGTYTANRSIVTEFPLAGISSFRYVPGALGNGWAFDITIDRVDLGSVQTIDLAYEISSYSNYTDGDLQIWVIADPTGTPTVIQPTPYKILKVSGPAKMQPIEFQTLTTTQSYRIVLHQATSTTTWGSFYFEIACGPKTKSVGPFMSDWESFTPVWTTSSGTLPAISTEKAWKKRVGDELWIRFRRIFSGAGTGSGHHLLTLPDGLAINSNKADSGGTGTQGQYNVGTWYDASASTTPKSLSFFSYSDTQVGIQATTGANTGANTDFAASDQIGGVMKIPIQGWSSNQVLSNEASSTVVSCRVRAASSGTINYSSSTPLVCGTTIWDTHSCWNSDTFTAKVPGYYRVTANGLGFSPIGIASPFYIVCTGTGAKGNGYFGSPAVANSWHGGSTVIYLPAGGTAKITNGSGSATTLQGSTDANYVTFDLIQGPAQIAASEKLYVRATTTAGQSIGTSLTDVIFGIVTENSYGSYNSSTGVFTAPRADIYTVASTLTTTNVALSTTQSFSVLAVSSNGQSRLLGSEKGNGATTWSAAGGTTSFFLNAGDTVKIRAISSVAVNLSTGSGECSLSITSGGW